VYRELKHQFDPVDLDLMEALTENARVPFSQLAQQMGLSNSLVHARVRKLKEAGVLTQPTYRVQPEALGYETCAFTQLMLTHARFLSPVVRKLEKIPEIVDCVNISGRYAVMVKIYATNNAHLRDVVYEKIQTIEGVEGTNTTVAFETPFSRGVPIRL
jgi:Lrp/AsnC family transcriptional regulator, regulator for asnA, asnC and gidA